MKSSYKFCMCEKTISYNFFFDRLKLKGCRPYFFATTLIVAVKYFTHLPSQSTRICRESSSKSWSQRNTKQKQNKTD